MTKKTIDKPNYTQMPNVLFDEHLAEMNVAELKVTLAICRETFGWHRPSHQLTYSDLERITGLSRKSIKAGIDAGIDRGTIGRKVQGRSFIYSLIVEEGNQYTKVTNDEQSTKVTDNSNPSPPESVTKSDQSRHDIKEKKENQKKETDSSPPSSSPIEAPPDTPRDSLIKLGGRYQFTLVPHQIDGLLAQFGEEAIRESIPIVRDQVMQMSHRFPQYIHLFHHLKGNYPDLRPKPPELKVVKEKPEERPPERTDEEKRQAALAYLEANPPKLDATPHAKRKPGEPNRHLGGAAPATAGLHQRRTA